MIPPQEKKEIIRKCCCLSCKWAERMRSRMDDSGMNEYLQIRCSLFQIWSAMRTKCPGYEFADAEGGNRG